MIRDRGEIAIGTIILITLLVWPINWVINKVAEVASPPEAVVEMRVVEIVPVGEIDGQVVYVIKERGVVP